MKALSKRDPADIFLEFVCEWDNVRQMADNYGRSEDEMRKILDKAQREIHKQN